MKVLAVIPSRFAAVRFPGKPLAVILDKPMVQWVYEAAAGARLVDETVVATDDARIAGVVKAFGGKARMTDPAHQNGTERIAEVASHVRCDIVVNVQGDEPAMDPRAVDQCVQPLRKDPSILMATLKTPLKDEAEARNPNVVKVVVDKQGDALYFSRSPIPFVRGKPTTVYKHLGIYAYRRDFLLEYIRWEPAALEQAESLEQLRALVNGVRIRVVETQWDSVGVDTPEDVERARALLEARHKRGRRP